MLGAVGVRSVDGGVRRHEPEPVTDEQGAGHGAHDLGGFPEDELDELRVLLGDLARAPSPRVDGSTVRRSTVQPSAFDTILLVITTTSPALAARGPAFDRTSTTIAGRSSPGCTIGTPGTPTSDTVGASIAGM